MDFKKYQGTGNDFILIDNRNATYSFTKEQVARYCHRRFGIGADGLILIEKTEVYDFKMVYHNADGAEGSMCGNGGRCAVKFAYDLGIIGSSTTFLAVDGPHKAQVFKNGNVRLTMIDVNHSKEEGGYYFNTGSPHLMVPVEKLSEINVYQEGKTIRNNDTWLPRGGVNVNFLEVQENGIAIRTYERGVEDETLSCGTGATACALFSHLQYGIPSPVKVNVLGGQLDIYFESHNHTFTNIYLEGPAEKVFEGQIAI